jgi:hypothetical protein
VTMKAFYTLILVLLAGAAYGQSNLPACQGSDSARWSNCFGSWTASDGDKYVGKWKINKGNSGSPVFDVAGNVVGITVGKLDSKKIQDEQGFVPEDVNFAIHIDRLPKITNASVDGKEPNTVELNTEELYQVMLGKVVMVATYK